MNKMISRKKSVYVLVAVVFCVTFMTHNMVHAAYSWQQVNDVKSLLLEDLETLHPAYVFEYGGSGPAGVAIAAKLNTFKRWFI